MVPSGKTGRNGMLVAIAACQWRGLSMASLKKNWALTIQSRDCPISITRHTVMNWRGNHHPRIPYSGSHRGQ